MKCSWGEGPNNFGVIVTGNIDVEFDYMSSIGDMIITPECKPEGERFEGFKAVAAAGKADGSLMLGQVTHAGRQVQKKIQPNPISASAVVLGMRFFISQKFVAELTDFRTQDGHGIRQAP